MGESRIEGSPRPIDGKSSFVYRASRYTTMIWLYALHRLRVRGTEYIPRKGPEAKGPLLTVRFRCQCHA